MCLVRNFWSVSPFCAQEFHFENPLSDAPSRLVLAAVTEESGGKRGAGLLPHHPAAAAQTQRLQEPRVRVRQGGAFSDADLLAVLTAPPLLRCVNSSLFPCFDLQNKPDHWLQNTWHEKHMTFHKVCSRSAAGFGRRIHNHWLGTQPAVVFGICRSILRNFTSKDCKRACLRHTSTCRFTLATFV